MRQEDVPFYYEQLYDIAVHQDKNLRGHYRQLRQLLEHICRQISPDNNLQITDLSARINLVASILSLSNAEQNRLHTCRMTCNDILNHRLEPTVELLLRDVKTISFFLQKASGFDIPQQLKSLLPHQNHTYLSHVQAVSTARKLRVTLLQKKGKNLIVRPQSSDCQENLTVSLDEWQPDGDNLFEEIEDEQAFHTLNLLDVKTDSAGILHPEIIVFEPDYLLDISTLAECFQSYGHHPLNYTYNRLQPAENTMPLLLGNIVNLFLDEWIYSKGDPDYISCMKKAFRQYPLELAACPDLHDPEKEQEFFDKCRHHFENLKTVIKETFIAPGYRLDKDDAVLEPSFICDALGLQGRLDYMQRDMHAFVEMKSGKADEYLIRGKISPRENNSVQMLLYEAVLEYSMNKKHQEVIPYLLYTHYPLLYPARSAWTQVKRAIKARNQIVALEYAIQRKQSIAYTASVISQIVPSTLNERQQTSTLWKKFQAPLIDGFANRFQALDILEKKYFCSLYTFICKELYTSKSGDTDYESQHGASSLWLSTFDEKCETGDILFDLHLLRNEASNPEEPRVILSHQMIADADMPTSLPNFRLGDSVILYERNQTDDTATNHLVTKGCIEAFSDQEITLRLRAPQRNLSILSAESLYAIEHDVMDSSFRSMFQGLASFLTANSERRALLLGNRKPRFDHQFDADIQSAQDDFQRITLKAQSAKDYFLLIGPPGTGKTSRALKGMVETFIKEGKEILLLSYTNRAVDEICKSIEHIVPQPSYIRIGNEMACEPYYRNHLLDNILKSCQNRKQVLQFISQCHIYIGTVSTISTKQDLFRLKHFDVAIIDESTQILEPQLLGLFCQQNPDNKNAIDKFIMIGDHKQLPAVVMQSAQQTKVTDEELNKRFITNLKDSLFERLYRAAAASCDAEDKRAYDMLCRQGRMNEVIADFPSKAFYQGRLIPLGLPHQHGPLPINPKFTSSPFVELMKCRVAFLPTSSSVGSSLKTNQEEAMIAASIAKLVYEQHTQIAATFSPQQTIGIITPYRTQIALIRQYIYKLGIEPLNHIMVDTVERYQGSERDIIIYSFCVNRRMQLDFLCNMTEDEGQLIDRKLNVALTRARMQLFLIGNEEILRQNQIYADLLDHATNCASITPFLLKERNSNCEL